MLKLLSKALGLRYKLDGLAAQRSELIRCAGVVEAVLMTRQTIELAKLGWTSEQMALIVNAIEGNQVVSFEVGNPVAIGTWDMRTDSHQLHLGQREQTARRATPPRQVIPKYLRST